MSRPPVHSYSGVMRGRRLGSCSRTDAETSLPYPTQSAIDAHRACGRDGVTRNNSGKWPHSGAKDLLVVSTPLTEWHLGETLHNV